jgi:hypothetical protein
MAALAGRGRVSLTFALPFSRSVPRLRSTPARLRAGVAAAVLLACCLATVIAVVSSGLDGDFQAIGQRDAPEVNAATGLYFSLNDMDAQVANVLLVGGDTGLTADKRQDLAAYASDRATADADLQQAAVTASGSVAAQRELRMVLNGIGQYEALAADALLADQQAPGTAGQDSTADGNTLAGKASPAALGYYRQASDLMRTGILPTVSSLTRVNAAGLDAASDAGRSAAVTSIVLTTVSGLLLLAALLALQVYLAKRFRRIVNPALALATLIAVGMTVSAVIRLNAEEGHLKVAKQDAFGSILALSQARAVSYDANADESRYLVDPARAAQYQQAFLTESQQLAAVGNVDIFGYDAALAADIRAYQQNNSNIAFGGYLGAEFRNITFPGERAAAVRALLAYQVYERDDRTLRALAAKNRAAAVAYDIGTAPGQSDWAFNRYSAALSSVVVINQDAFTSAVAAGQGNPLLDGMLPVAGAVLLVVLALAGVRPRLAEYKPLSVERSHWLPASVVSSGVRNGRSEPVSANGFANETLGDEGGGPPRRGPASSGSDG